MKLKTVGIMSAAAFAFAFALSASAVQPSASCVSCHNSCDRTYDACVAAGTDPSACLSRVITCHNGCRCPAP